MTPSNTGYVVHVTGNTLTELYNNFKTAWEEWDAVPDLVSGQVTKLRTAPVDDTDAEETDDEDETFEAEDEEPKRYSLKDDIIPAFQDYAKKHSRAKATEILKKFKVASVKDLKASTYPKVMAALS